MSIFHLAQAPAKNVSSSGSRVEDILHPVSRKVEGSNSCLRTPVIIGCGKMQSGGYLEEIVPAGLWVLDLEMFQFPVFWQKKDSLSLCFSDDDSGRIYFADNGIFNQQTTPFLP